MYTLFFDGCCKGNPGISGCGAVLYKNETYDISDNIDIYKYENEIWTSNHYIGYNTNNASEYNGLIIGLTQVVVMGIKELVVKGDSLLVINQMKGEYNINSKKLF